MTGGELGVAIFFAISGYLVTASLLASQGLVVFFSKRILRIFPGLIVVVLLTAFALGPVMTTLTPMEYFHHQATRDYLFNILLWIHFPLPGVFVNLPEAGGVNGSLWTLPIEASMYVLLALLAVFGTMQQKIRTFSVILFFIGFAHLASGPSHKALYVWRIGPAIECMKFGVYFFSGVMLYELRNLIPWRTDIALALLALWILTFKTRYGICSMFVAIPYTTIFLGRSSNQIISNFGKYGDFSYGIYIYAFPIQQSLIEIFGKNLSPYLFFFYSLGITTCFAFLSWHLVERPALRLKEWLRPARISATVN